MIKAEATCQRNTFSEIRITIKCNAKIMYNVCWCDAMTRDVHREEISNFVAFSGCIYNDESCLRERSVSAVDKDVHTWVTSAYKG